MGRRAARLRGSPGCGASTPRVALLQITLRQALRLSKPIYLWSNRQAVVAWGWTMRSSVSLCGWSGVGAPVRNWRAPEERMSTGKVKAFQGISTSSTGGEDELPPPENGRSGRFLRAEPKDARELARRRVRSACDIRWRSRSLQPADTRRMGGSAGETSCRFGTAAGSGSGDSRSMVTSGRTSPTWTPPNAIG